VVFISQLALFPTFSIVLSHLNEKGSGALMSASAASIGLLGQCLAAFLMERLQSTTHMVVAAHILNACGILASTLGLLLGRPVVWSPIMLLMGLSDISPFIYKTSGMCGESQQLIRLSGPFYLVFATFATGWARLLGGVLRDAGGMPLVLRFTLVVQITCGVLNGVYSVYLRAHTPRAAVTATSTVAATPTALEKFSRFASKIQAQWRAKSAMQLKARAKIGYMVYGLQAIVFVTGCVTGILAAGAMLRFELRFGVSNSVTGMFYFAAFVIGTCCLLAMTTFKGSRRSDKIKIFKPPFDLIIFLALLLAFFALYTVDSFRTGRSWADGCIRLLPRQRCCLRPTYSGPLYMDVGRTDFLHTETGTRMRLHMHMHLSHVTCTSVWHLYSGVSP
jgi:hypothetical protein